MKKIVILIGILVILPITPAENLTLNNDQFIEEIDKSINQHRDVGCSIQVTGEIQFSFKPTKMSFGENNLIFYWPIEFIDGSVVTISIDNEVYNYDSGGKMNIVGFFGIYVSDNDLCNEDTLHIHLDGKAVYVKILGEHHNEVDDTYLPIVNSLNGITHSLDSSPLELSNEDLESLAYLSNSKIVGLGEATHGTKEFFQMKHRIFKYLVENHDFKVFAFECDMGESYYVNNYVLNGEGDIDDIMINIMHFWTWRTKEVKDLLVWMKEYNTDKTDEDKIYFIGIDCQLLTYQSDVIIDYFNRVCITLPNECIDFLHEIDQLGGNNYDFYDNITVDKKNEIIQKTDTLLAKIVELKDELINASSAFEYQFIKQIALNIKHVADVAYSYYHGDGVNYRDLYMKENTLWTSAVFGEDTKVALWAHNGHVSNYEWYQSIGYHLKNELYDEYQIIDFGFSFGGFTAIKQNINGNILCTNYITRQPLFDSINYIFHYAQDDNFILRELDIQDGSDFDIWISNLHGFLEFGAIFNGNSHRYYYSIDFKEYCDVLIYLDNTNPAEQLNPTSRNSENEGQEYSYSTSIIFN